MREETIAGFRVRLTGGLDRRGGGDGPMVLLMHGFGAPGTDLVPLWRQLDVPPETRFAFPEALLDLASVAPAYGPARAWWMIDIAKLQLAVMTGRAQQYEREVPEGLQEARQRVLELLDELESAWSAPRSRLVLGGFSQGAMLACDVALRSPRPFAGLALLSGALMNGDEWERLAPERRGLPVFQSHGQADPILPFESATRLRELLSAAGLPVDWVSFNGGHGIAPAALDGLAKFIRRVTREAP